MKTSILAFLLAIVAFRGFAENHIVFSLLQDTSKVKHDADSVKLLVDGVNAYYQKVVKTDSNLTEGKIYMRALQFMASKNIMQTYGYQEEGKLIFATSQDLNFNQVYVGDDNEIIWPYTVQFAIILDLKNGHYRYTINHVVFFLPTDTGNKRETLDEINEKATNTDSRRVAKEAKKLLVSFERYLTKLTNELDEGIEQKLTMFNSNF